MNGIPKWALKKARELAALWNDPGQEAAIARALAEAAPKWISPCDGVAGERYLLAVDGHVYEGYCANELWFFADHDRVKGKIDAIMPLPAPPEVGQ